MSFMSMLQMAKGKAPPPDPKPYRKPEQPSTPRPTSSQSTDSSSELIRQQNHNEPLYDSASSVKIGKPSSANGRAAPPKNALGPSRNVTVPSKVLSKAPSKASSNASEPHQFTKTKADTRDKPAHLANPAKIAQPGVSVSRATQAEPVASPKKKLSFKDMMRKASSIDKSKLEMNLRVTTRPQSERLSRSQRQRQKPREVGKDIAEAAKVEAPVVASTKLGTNSRPSSLKPSSRPTSTSSVIQRGPAPLAQPFPELLEKVERQKKQKQQQRSKGRYDDDDEEDLDDFVVSEEEELEPESSIPHEDIWSLFNKRPRKYYDDSDSDDMEARGADILDEERRSAAVAKREDVEEERKLEELSKRKKLRKLGPH